MLNTWTKIETNGLLTLFPSPSFIDKRYEPNEVVREDYFSEEIITEERFKLVNDQFEDFQKVQTILYKKYSLKIFAKENSDIQHIRFAQNVFITLYSGEQHKAKILQLDDGEKVEGTENRLYELIYYDINIANYRNGRQPVNNFLKYEFTSQIFDNIQQNRVTLRTSKTINDEFTELGDRIDLRTILVPVLSNAEVQQEILIKEGVEYPTRSIIKKQAILTFYTGYYEKNIVERYGPLCDTITSRYTLNGVLYENIQGVGIVRPVVTRVTRGVDLYKVVIRVEHDDFTFNHNA